MPELTGVIPTLYVRDVSAAGAHYRRLGFEVRVSETLAIARRDAVTLDLAKTTMVDELAAPLRDVLPFLTTIMITTRDRAALRKEWAPEKVGGRMEELEGYSEFDGFLHVDPDGNRLQIIPEISFGGEVH